MPEREPAPVAHALVTEDHVREPSKGDARWQVRLDGRVRLVSEAHLAVQESVVVRGGCRCAQHRDPVAVNTCQLREHARRLLASQGRLAEERIGSGFAATVASACTAGDAGSERGGAARLLRRQCHVLWARGGVGRCVHERSGQATREAGCKALPGAPAGRRSSGGIGCAREVGRFGHTCSACRRAGCSSCSSFGLRGGRGISSCSSGGSASPRRSGQRQDRGARAGRQGHRRPRRSLRGRRPCPSCRGSGTLLEPCAGCARVQGHLWHHGGAEPGSAQPGIRPNGERRLLCGAGCELL
mmetsp:Transcript_13838/g.43306  ORF Transcript_13838/g.43306 Transcript_13838/m.43306 type:complete len:299 (-) Transcript_13838:847-1743(-)